MLGGVLGVLGGGGIDISADAGIGQVLGEGDGQLALLDLHVVGVVNGAVVLIGGLFAVVLAGVSNGEVHAALLGGLIYVDSHIGVAVFEGAAVDGLSLGGITGILQTGDQGVVIGTLQLLLEDGDQIALGIALHDLGHGAHIVLIGGTLKVLINSAVVVLVRSDLVVPSSYISGHSDGATVSRLCLPA